MIERIVSTHTHSMHHYIQFWIPVKFRFAVSRFVTLIPDECERLLYHPAMDGTPLVEKGCEG